jgi:CRISPR-associated protein Cas6
MTRGDANDMADLQFSLDGRAVPVDSVDALRDAVCELLPWLDEEPHAGIHPLSGISPGDGEGYVSRRSRLTLRLPNHRLEEAKSLAGRSLALGGHTIVPQRPVVRELSYSPVIYAKFVAMMPAADTPVAEDAFLAACEAALATLGIGPKLICGKARRAHVPGGMLSGFSLMVYDLDRETNLRLQHEGLGLERRRGCGIFIPHKSGAAVGTIE